MKNSRSFHAPNRETRADEIGNLKKLGTTRAATPLMLLILILRLIVKDSIWPMAKLNGLGVTTPEHFYLVDFIPGLHAPTKIDARSVVRLYREGLSAQQVAERLDISKQAVLARLRRFDVRNCRRGRAPDNFRHMPPYGQKVWGRRLVLNKKEIQIVRLIVRLRDREQFRWSEIVARLVELGVKTRTGKTWSRTGVRRVHRRWSGKV